MKTLIATVLFLSLQTYVQSQVQCDFEDDNICNFVQGNDDDQQWTVLSGPTGTANTGPAQAAAGTQYYVYYETSDPVAEGDIARLQTPAVGFSGSGCVRFWYHMYGDQLGQFNVRLGSTSLLALTGDQGNTWTQIEADVTVSGSNSRLTFEAIKGTGIRSDVAVDEVMVTSGSCAGGGAQTTTITPATGTANLPIVCGFENDFCNLEQSTSDQFDWTRQSGGTQSGNTGPDGAFEGNFYIYTEASSPRAQGDEAKLETRRINAAGDICIRFNYHMFGTTVGRFYVYTSGRSGTPLLDLSGQLGNVWNDASLDASIANGDRVYFVGVRSTDVFGDIAMDNVRITGGRCTTGIDLPAVFDVRSCDSESSSSSTCRMVQDTSSDNFDWSMNELKTPSAIHFREINGQKYPITGPSSAQSGLMYIYAEASGRSSGDISRVKFEGSDFNRGGDNCLRFFYMMNGFHVGELSAYVIRSGTRVKLWSVQGDKLQNWFKANVDIDMDGVSEVGLQATMTGLFNGDIAVDSVQMTSFTCEGHLPEDVQWRCRMELDDGSSSLCGMEQDTNDAFDWTMGQGDTKSMETGPSGAQSGNFYIFIEASSPRVEGDSANIMSPVIGRGGVRCVSFRYSMYGFHTGSLRLSIRSSGGSVSQIWEQSGDKGQGWQSARVTANGTGSYRIMFTGVRGTGYSGDIALDTIQITPRSCGCC